MRMKRRVILTIILVVLFLLTVLIVDSFDLAKEKEYGGTLVQINIREGDT